MSPFRDAASCNWPGDPGWPGYLAPQDLAADTRERSEEQLEVTVYAGAHCVRSWRVKRLLRRKGYAFEVVDVTGEHGGESWLVRAAASKTLPLVFVDGRPVGGLHEIRVLDRSGDLDRLVRGDV
jgi:glutaredoxin 3